MDKPTPHTNSSSELTLPAFGVIERERVLAMDDLFAVVSDKFPVSRGHTLIIPRRSVTRFQELNAPERVRLLEWVDWAQKQLLATLTPSPDAFNLGVNDGKAAGQTMPQFHFHVIPRHSGDTTDPRGGIRWVRPDKARYWEDCAPKDGHNSTGCKAIERCNRCLCDESLRTYIHAGCLPVPAFGDIRAEHVRVATIGLNPSSTEFFAGHLLKNQALRLPHLDDYGAASRESLTPLNIIDATRRRATYFAGAGRSPHAWFVKLASVLEACGRDWNYENGSAVHVDLVACTAGTAWGEMPHATKEALIQNCHSHLTATIAHLPQDAWLFADGRTAGDTLAGDSGEWYKLCEFRDDDGNLKPIRVRSGNSAKAGGGRRYCAWNIPAKHLPEEMLAKVATWAADAIRSAGQ